MTKMLRFVFPFIIFGVAFSQPVINGVFDGEGVWGPPVATSTDGFHSDLKTEKLYVKSFGSYLYLAAVTSGDAKTYWQEISWAFNINTVPGGGASHPYTLAPDPVIQFCYADQPDYIVEGTYTKSDWVINHWNGTGWDQTTHLNSPDVGIGDDYIEVRISKSAIGNAGEGDVQFYLYTTYDLVFDACPDDLHPGNDLLTNYAAGLALPVQLASFSATTSTNGTTLVWKTATELNNAGFEVERRETRDQPSTVSNWQRLAFILGHGTSNAPNEYSYTDANLAPGRYVYRLKQIDNDGSFSYSHEAEVDVVDVPTELALGQNFPNPFNPETAIGYSLLVAGEASLRVYDLLGREVAVLVDGVQGPGTYTVPFNGTSLASGTYVYQLQVNGTTLTKVMTLLR